MAHGKCTVNGINKTSHGGLRKDMLTLDFIKMNHLGAIVIKLLLHMT